VQQNEAEVPAGLGSDLIGITSRASLHEVNCTDDIVDTQAEESLANKFGTKNPPMLTTVERRIASFQAEAGGSSRNGVLIARNSKLFKTCTAMT